MSWLYLVLGIWTFVSPWVFNYTSSTGALWSSLIVGIVLFVGAIYDMTVNAGHISQPAH